MSHTTQSEYDFTEDKRGLARWRVIQNAKQLRRMVDQGAAEGHIGDAYRALVKALDELEALGG